MATLPLAGLEACGPAATGGTGPVGARASAGASHTLPHGRTAPAVGPAAPPPAAAPAPAPWLDYSTVFTNAKAGMEGVDKEHVQRVVYEMSKDSAHFRNEQRKAAATEARIAAMQQRAQRLTAAEVAAAERALDARIAALEAGRDLSRTWAHADMDCFFAAVHEAEQPELKRVPMAVGGMGMISTANYVARRYGVRSAMPGFIGKRLCPQLVFVRPDFAKYTAAAERVRAVFREFDPDFESGGLDEAALDLTDYCARTRTTGEQAACELRRRVREECGGLTCSVGVAANKMLAKICSDINKPDGQYVLPPRRDAIVAFLDTLPARKIPCIGKVTEAVLRAVLGVAAAGELRGPCRGRMALLFSESAAAFFLQAALGLAPTRHAPKVDTSLEPGRKGISCERTFRDMAAPAAQEAMAKQLVESVAADMADEGIEGRTVTLKLKLSTFEVRTRACTLARHTAAVGDMLPAVLRLLRAEQPLTLRLMGVRMSALRKANAATRSPLARMLGLRPRGPATASGGGAGNPGGSAPQPHGNPLSSCAGELGFIACVGPPGSAPAGHVACGGGAAAAATRTTEPGATPPRGPLQRGPQGPHVVQEGQPCSAPTTPRDPGGAAAAAGGGGGADVLGEGGCMWAAAGAPGEGGWGALAGCGRDAYGDGYDDGCSEHSADLYDAAEDAADEYCEDDDVQLLEDGCDYDNDVRLGAGWEEKAQQRLPLGNTYMGAAAERGAAAAEVCELEGPRPAKRPCLAQAGPAAASSAALSAAATAAAAGNGLALDGTAGMASGGSACLAVPAATVAGNGGGTAAHSGITAAAATWACRVCTYARNRRQLLRCEVCDCVRGSTEAPPLPPPPGRLSGVRPGEAGAATGAASAPAKAPPASRGSGPLQALWAAASGSGGASAGSRSGAAPGSCPRAGGHCKSTAARTRPSSSEPRRVCHECGAAVLPAQWLEHQDWHVALRLSRV